MATSVAFPCCEAGELLRVVFARYIPALTVLRVLEEINDNKANLAKVRNAKPRLISYVTAYQ